MLNKQTIKKQRGSWERPAIMITKRNSNIRIIVSIGTLRRRLREGDVLRVSYGTVAQWMSGSCTAKATPVNPAMLVRVQPVPTIAHYGEFLFV